MTDRAEIVATVITSIFESTSPIRPQLLAVLRDEFADERRMARDDTGIHECQDSASAHYCVHAETCPCSRCRWPR
jgi:hypothetical protein